VAKHQPKDVKSFYTLLDKVWWHEIPQDHIRHLYHSIPARVQACIRAEGRMTTSKY